MGKLPGRLRVAGTTAIVVLALGAAGCGDSADDTDTAQASARDVAGALRTMQDAFYAGDVEQVCQSLSLQARKEVAQGGHGRRTSCEEGIGDLVRLQQAGGGVRGPRPEIVRTRVEGSEATILMREGHRPPYRVPMAREAGAWKVDLALTTGLQGR